MSFLYTIAIRNHHRNAKLIIKIEKKKKKEKILPKQHNHTR